MNYTDNQLIHLAQNEPNELARLLVNPTASVKMLVAGVEILGEEAEDEKIVLPVLRQLLNHIHAAVREGAAVGVSSFYAKDKLPSDILDRLRFMSQSDPSPNVKNYAKFMLQEFE
jgi:hypothetical protein